MTQMKKKKKDVYKMNPKDKRQDQCHNILSFDGGGIRGYCSLLMFEKYCKELQNCIPDHNVKDSDLNDFVYQIIREKFDLICGTSIGGIIAIMLALGIPFSELKDLFLKKGSTIFQKEWFFKRIVTTKYSDEGLKTVYKDLMIKYKHKLKLTDSGKNKVNLGGEWYNNLKMGEIDFNVAVLAYDLLDKQSCYFSSTFKQTVGVNIIDALLSTSAAPTYFPIHKFSVMVPMKEDEKRVLRYDLNKGEKQMIKRDLFCVDGGVYANDPALVCHFAQSFRNRRHKNMIYNIISFGTGREKPHAPSTFFENSISWILGEPAIFDVMMDATTELVSQIFGNYIKTGHVVNIKVQLELEGRITLDDYSKTALDNQKAYFDKKDKSSTSEMSTAVKNAIGLTMLMGWKD